MSPNLHRSDAIPDWERVAPERRNYWQRVAAKTRGLLTPGNLMSVTGLALVLDGLYDFSQGQRAIGITKVAAGKLADYFDGDIADKTGTKSRTGEAVDAGCDTGTVVAALGVAAVTDAIPLLPLAAISARNAATIGVTTYAKVRGYEIHATAAAKANQFAQWLTMGSFLTASSVDTTPIHEALQAAGWTGAAISVPLGTYATIQGYREATAGQNTQQSA